MTEPLLSSEQKLEIYYWMRLTRAFDDLMVATWRQGRGLGGVFSQRGHEAVSVGSGYAMEPDDVVAPMHRDLGCYLLRGMKPERIFGNMLGRADGISHGRDVNLHGGGDLDLNLIGFISHLPHSLPVAVGAAMSFLYRDEPRVVLTYVGDGSSSAGLFHESLNLASLVQAPFVLIIENNQYAYSTPISEQTHVTEFAARAGSYGIPNCVIDGNDVEAVYTATKKAVDRACGGKGPSVIQCETMRMLGHAIHDGAEYVPEELLAKWEARNPVKLYAEKLVADGICGEDDINDIGARCEEEVAEAFAAAEASPLPDPVTVSEDVYAP